MTSTQSGTVTTEDLRTRLQRLLADHDPATTDARTFLRARFDAGLARVAYPHGLGGCGADATAQPGVDATLAAAGAPTNRPLDNAVGLGMAAPTLLLHGTAEQQQRWMRPLWTGEELWCQLFSEPGSGSDLASLATRAVRDGSDWVVSGTKVWTSLAHQARWAILLARTDPDVPKHRGITYFVCDMHAAGVQVRPLRQLTGETEFNEVTLDRVRVPDAHRIGEVGQGWAIAQATLANERVSYTSGHTRRGSGPIAWLLDAWCNNPERRSPALRDRVVRLWVEAEAVRLTSARMGQQQALGNPGPESSATKLEHARLNQEISDLALDLLGSDGLRHDSYAEGLSAQLSYEEHTASWRYLRTRANSIEGGTSEIMRTIIAERVLGLPPEPRTDKHRPWKDVPR